MRPIGSARQLEKRRLKAIELFADGDGPYVIARKVGAAPKSVYRWLDAYRRAGCAGVAPKPPGRPKARLTPEQRQALVLILIDGPRAAGIKADLWTLPRVAKAIRRHFRVAYHPAHVSRLLRDLDWSRQKPAKQAKERNEFGIGKWINERWPAVKRRRSRREPSSPSSTNAESR